MTDSVANPYGESGPPGPPGTSYTTYQAPAGLSPDDSKNLERSAKALGLTNILLSVITLLLAVSLVLGIIGFIALNDKAANIEDDVHTSSEHIATWTVIP